MISRRCSSNYGNKRWLKDYSLGQLWEKNEIGGRPAREEGLRDSAR